MYYFELHMSLEDNNSRVGFVLSCHQLKAAGFGQQLYVQSWNSFLEMLVRFLRLAWKQKHKASSMIDPVMITTVARIQQILSRKSFSGNFTVKIQFHSRQKIVYKQITIFNTVSTQVSPNNNNESPWYF